MRSTVQSRPLSRSLLQSSTRVPCLLSARSNATSRPILSHSANPRSSVESFGPSFANNERICDLRCHRASVSVCDCAEMKPKQKAGFSENPSAVAGAMLNKINVINIKHLIQIMCQLRRFAMTEIYVAESQKPFPTYQMFFASFSGHPLCS